MERIDLNGKWTVEGISPTGEKLNLCGNVPGSALGAVLEDMKDFDVFYRDNAEQVQKYENYDWIYTKSFVVQEAGKRLELVFDRLDTYCDIYVNGKHISHCENGFILHRFDISHAVIEGENTIKIYFYSPVLSVRGRKPRDFCAFSTDRLYTRRMQCTYGWDWTMRFVTCGVGDAYIEIIPEGMKVDNAYVYTKSIDEDCAEVVADIYFTDFEEGGLISVEMYDPDGELAGKYERYNEEAFMRVSIDVETPKLWYPNGYGEANLYNVVVKCGEEVLYTTLFGIRTVKIMQLADKTGDDNYNKCLKLKTSDITKAVELNDEFSCFTVKVNGEKIMCKGGNWVPCEPFVSVDTKEKITKLLTLAKDAGVNILRVWGGGQFESEHFYNECSRLGIMVTQDFLMACGDYPEEQDWFLDTLRMEAEYIVRLIRNKPCLIWWCGDNENATWGTNYLDWYHGRSNAYKAIGPVLYKEDYLRVFIPSSPFGGNMYASNTVGITHNSYFLSETFKYADETEMEDFKDKLKELRARFIAEEPTMGAASLTSLRKFMTDEDIFGDDMSIWLYHTKNNPAIKKELFDYELEMAEKLFGKFKNGTDRLFKLKYLQYEWIRISFEQARREKWFCSGVLCWMFNDCWPAATGWSLIDYYCMPKASYYSFKRAAKPVVGSIDCNDGVYSLHICNDGRKQTVNIKCFTTQGREIIAETEMEIPANSSITAFETDKPLGDGEVMIMEIADADGNRDRAFYKHGKLILNPCDVQVVEKTENSITVKADKYIHAVELESEAVFEDNYFSLMPNEARRIKFSGSGDIAVCGYTL